MFWQGKKPQETVLREVTDPVFSVQSENLNELHVPLRFRHARTQLRFYDARSDREHSSCGVAALLWVGGQAPQSAIAQPDIPERAPAFGEIPKIDVHAHIFEDMPQLNPNFYVDCAARTRGLTRQPREKVRSFFIKYQDRILYGVDSTWKPSAKNARRPSSNASSSSTASTGDTVPTTRFTPAAARCNTMAASSKLSHCRGKCWRSSITRTHGGLFFDAAQVQVR